MKTPVFAEELSQFVHCCRWMWSGIPNFAEVSEPLDEVLENAYKKVGKRKRSAIKGLKVLNLGWGSRQDKAFM